MPAPIEFYFDLQALTELFDGNARHGKVQMMYRTRMHYAAIN